MSTMNLTKKPSSIVPSYARLPLGIAVGILVFAPLAYYWEVGRSLTVSHSPTTWAQFATYLGGVTGPTLALIASWLVVVNVRESLNLTTRQIELLMKQQASDEAETTFKLATEVHSKRLEHFEGIKTMTSLVSEIEELAFKDIESFKGVLSTTEYESKVNLQLHTAYIEIRSAYEELLGPYMSTARLCLEMLFELETGTSVSPKTVGPSLQRTTLQSKVYMTMLSEEETRLLLLEAAYYDRKLGAMLSWADVRVPIIPDYVINDMSPVTCALHDGYGAIHSKVILDRIDYFYET